MSSTVAVLIEIMSLWVILCVMLETICSKNQEVVREREGDKSDKNGWDFDMIDVWIWLF